MKNCVMFIIIVAALFACTDFKVERKSYTAALNLLKFSHNDIQNEIDEIREFNYKYDRPNKYRFANLSQIFKESVDSLESYSIRRRNIIMDKDSLETLIFDMNDYFNRTKQRVIDTILADTDVFGLTLVQAKDIVTMIDTISMNNSGIVVGVDYFNFIILEFDFFQKFRGLRNISEILMGGVYNEYWAFPVVSTEKCSFREGDTMNLKISIGSYSSSYYPEDVIIIAGQDTVHMGEDGIAHYYSVVGDGNNGSVPLEFQVLNRQTGEIVSGHSSFIYEILK